MPIICILMKDYTAYMHKKRKNPHFNIFYALPTQIYVL